MIPDPAVTSAALQYLLSGDLQRDLGEIREHTAALERELPRGGRARIVRDFGHLLDPEFTPNPEPIPSR